MRYRFELQELAIALVAQNLNPTAINAEGLQYGVIASVERELARSSVYEEPLQPAEIHPVPVSLLTGYFKADLLSTEPQERVAEVQGLIADWQTQVSRFRELIETRLMGQVQPLAMAG